MASSTATLDQAVEDFRHAVGCDGPVAVRGGGSRDRVGGESMPGTRQLGAPGGVVEHKPAEMTVRVRAGTPVHELHAVLAEAGQRTALPDRGGTVGGAVAVGENAVDRLGRGSVRDAVLQVTYVSAEGKLVRGGGPVVKNVSGFNLPKLLTGSLGTLGLVAEVILRTNPIPPVSRWVRSAGGDPFVAREAVLAPAAVLWDGTATWVLIEGHAADVEAEHAALRRTAEFAEVSGPPELPPHRWMVSPAEVRSFATDERPWVASIGVGTVWASWPSTPVTLTPGVALVSARLKSQFDPTGRLNPGRTPGVC